MRCNRVIGAALLAVAATGIAHLILSERQHRDRTVLEAARIHQQLLAAQVERPGLRAMWGSLDPLDSGERRLHLHRNAWVSAWEAMFRVGALTPVALDGAARALFATPEGLHWWARVREERSRAAADTRTRRFHVLMDTAYQDETGTILPAVHPAEAAHDVDTPYTSSSN